MKTILSLLLLLFVASCAQTPSSKYKTWDVASSRPGRAAAESPKAATPAVPAAPAPAPEIATNAAPSPETVFTNVPVAAGTLVETNAHPSLKPKPSKIPPSAAARAAAAAATNAPAEDMVGAGMINFQAMDINQVLQVYSELVNRTILRPANLGAPQITLKTQTALTKKEAIQALDAVFAMNGITIINIGDKFAKAVPAAQGAMEGGARDNRDPGELPELGQYLTRIVQLKYAKPSELVPVLQPFAKAPSSIMPIENSGILVLRDYTENIKRMLELVQQVDVTVQSEFISEVVPIKYAKAADISSALNSLGGGGGGTSIGRSTSGANRSMPSMGGGLNRPGGTGAAGGYGGGAYGAQGTTTPTAAGGAMGAGGSFTSRMQQIISKAAASGDMQIIGQNKIIADERSNSLLIFATRQDMDTITNIISKLDVVLAQVLIETVILDVQIGNSWALGVSAGQYPKTGKTGSVGGAYNNASSGSSTPLDSLSKFFGNETISNSASIFPSTSSGLSYFGRYKGDLDVAVQAAASDSRVNVIQKPQIITSHATPASIFIGSTVPYVTSTYYGGGYGGPSSSYQQLQVGIGLQVTPYINQDGLVVMTIDESIDELSGSTDITGVGSVPNTTSRKLSAEVAVRDGDTIILGGFIRNSDTKQNAGVPILKDIPILGALFTSRSDSKERKELLVLMRPTVLKTPEIAGLETARQKRRLPGISSAEAEIRNDERELMRGEKKKVARQKSVAKRRGYTDEESASDDPQP